VVKLNSRTRVTSGVNCEFDFQVLASELIAGADRVKSPRAQTPEGSIGAQVNFKTVRPLDNPGMHISSSVNDKYGELSDTADLEVSALICNTFSDKIPGINIATTRQCSLNRYDAAGTTRWALMASPFTAIDGDIRDTRGNVVTPECLCRPDRIEFSPGEKERERTGINTTLQR